ncbi:MAG: transglutaminase-like domain-containing protein [Ignavibacteria bacterium]|nr:transglutaminase-like domain-containing protein [Ignavibacteria bacterium]
MLNSEEATLGSKELDHLIRLLDDEDEKIYGNIRDRFISYGDLSSEYLKNFTEDDNLLVRDRAKEIISTINIEKLEKKFQELSKGKNILEDAVFLIAEFGYPGYDKLKYKRMIDMMAEEIRKNLTSVREDFYGIPAILKLNAINSFLYDEKGYAGNKDDYYDTDNSFINRVLDTKLGIPVTLSIIYILIARRLGLPVHGVNLPGHFIVKYQDEAGEYFIDPFNQGLIVSRDEAAEFIKNLGMTDEEFENLPYLNAADDKDIVLRMLRNLSENYKNKNDDIKASQVERLMIALI